MLEAVSSQALRSHNMNASVQRYYDQATNTAAMQDDFNISLAKSKVLTFLHESVLARSIQGSTRGWGGGPEKALLTLTRSEDTQAWGFSCHGGDDLEHWGGLLSGGGGDQRTC